MKKLFFLLLTLISLTTFGQVYNPSRHTVSNKAYGVAQAAPTDARSMFYDEDNFVYRAYVSTAEVLTYLSLPKYRTGQFDIVVNTGGVLGVNGVITGGTNAIWFFRDGTADGDLILKIADAADVYEGENGITIADFTAKLGGTGTENTTIAWGAFSMAHTFNSLAGGSGFSITSTSTGAASGTQKLVNISLSGANATSAQETRALHVSNTHTGTTSSNTALYVEANSGTSNNIAIKARIGSAATNSSVIDALNEGTGHGVTAQTTNGIPLWGISGASHTAVVGSANGGGYSFSGTSTNSGTNTILSVAAFNRASSGTPANNIGGRFELIAGTSAAASGQEAAQIIWDWTNATTASRTSRLRFAVVNNAGATTTRWEIAGNGGLKGSAYGAGTFTGTATKWAAWDADGDLIEVDPPTGGSTSASDLTSGTLADARLSSNIPKKDAANTFTSTNDFQGITATTIAVGTVDNTEFSYLNGLSSAIQTQLDSKAATATTITIYNAGAAQSLAANRTFYPKSVFQQAIEALGSSVKGQSVGVNMDQMSISTFAAVDGTAYWTAVWLPSPATLTGVKYWLGSQGNFTGDNFNGFALYTYDGAGTLTQVATSANDANIWKGTSNSYQSVPFTSSYVAAAGLYFVAFIRNSSAEVTAPTFGISNSVQNGGMQSGDFTNSAKLNSTQTTEIDLPTGTKAFSALTVTTLRPWIGLY
jgi:hypothetical protein